MIACKKKRTRRKNSESPQYCTNHGKLRYENAKSPNHRPHWEIRMKNSKSIKKFRNHFKNRYQYVTRISARYAKSSSSKRRGVLEPEKVWAFEQSAAEYLSSIFLIFCFFFRRFVSRPNAQKAATSPRRRIRRSSLESHTLNLNLSTDQNPLTKNNMNRIVRPAEIEKLSTRIVAIFDIFRKRVKAEKNSWK